MQRIKIYNKIYNQQRIQRIHTCCFSRCCRTAFSRSSLEEGGKEAIMALNGRGDVFAKRTNASPQLLCNPSLT